MKQSQREVNYEQKNHLLFTMIILLFIMVSSCTSKSDNNQNLEVKDKKEVASKSISNLTDSLDFTINDQTAKILVEKDSVDANTNIIVSTSEITSNNLSVATNAITPLISIEVSQPLEKALKVQIPIEKKENEVVVAVQYQFDENVINTLESVFTEDEVLEVMIYATTDFFVSSVAEDLVLATIDTGFRPSVDGFQTNNISTYWENGGMCSGMVNGALYYYLTKKPSLGPLYNRYHENSGMPFATPNFWNDDFSAISLTTTLQNVSYHEDYYDYFNFTRLENSAKHFYRMAYHMMISNKPQVIHLFDKPFTSDRSNDPLVGHSVIAYKILANHVYVYDPNYPNNDSLKIELDTSSENIKPYVGALSSESKQSSFTNMFYYPSNIILNTQGLDPYFTKIENNEAIVTLPEYNLVEVLKNNNSTNYIKLSNNHKTHKNTIDITLTLPKNGYVKV